jgi:hypothetical protein
MLSMCLYDDIRRSYIKVHLYDDIHHRFKDDRMMIYIRDVLRWYAMNTQRDGHFLCNFGPLS